MIHRKTTIIILSFFLLVSLFSIAAFSEEENSTQTFELSKSKSSNTYTATIEVDKNQVNPGESFTLTVKKTDTNTIYSSSLILITGTDENTPMSDYFSVDSITVTHPNFLPDASPEIKVRDAKDEGETYNAVSVNFGKQSTAFSTEGELYSVSFKVNENAPTGKLSFLNAVGTGSSFKYYIKSNNVLTINSVDYSGQFGFDIEIVGDNASTPSITGALTAEESKYNCGDIVKVTAKLTPDAATKLSSGSLKFNYDTDKLTFTGAEVNQTLTNGRATLYENKPGTCVASFTSEGDALDVTTDGFVLAEFSFEAVKDGTADFEILETVAADEKAFACTTQTGDSLSVTINALPKVTTDDFGSDYKIVKYVADALPESGNAYYIGDMALTYVPAYAVDENAGKYIFVMLSKDEPTDKTVTTKTGSYGAVTATGDANGDTKTNIIDAQVVYYMTTNKITSSDAGFDWLNSDVNGSCQLDANDARAIQYFVHYGQFGQFSS